MAGRSLEDAKAAYRASQRHQRTENSSQSQTTSVNVALTGIQSSTTVSQSPDPLLITINGVSYTPVPTATAVPSVASSLTPNADAAMCAFTSGGSVTTLDAEYDFDACIAICGESRAPVNWDQHTKLVDLNQVPLTPSLADTGADSHISPERSDFKTLRPISPHPIAGVGGSCIYAIGIGTVEICVSAGHKLTLDDVLFAPASIVRLISVLALNRSGNYISHFDRDSFWLTSTSGKTILRGTIYENRRIYCLSLPKARTAHSHIDTNATTTPGAPSNASDGNAPPIGLYAPRTPDVETWHRRLGHCNFDAIVDMARKGAVEGLKINLSSSPPKCDACILGKQTRMPVPRVREGEKASQPLERVFVDVWGLIRPISSSGRLYSMNVIDDYSGYVWSLPLRSKGEAASILQMWHRAVVNQSEHRLKILVSDEGELVSNSMEEWCAHFGIDHQRTAPNTSAHNAKHLHRTLLDKARAMLRSCKAPANFWDEFCATSAYLTNLTASSSLQGRTPFELWFGRRPSLSHLREIGCRAFALVQTANPKNFAWSPPCVLIGYFPRSKAYRLWDTASGRIFNSNLVTLLEHLDEQPADLLPGTTIALAPESPPSWDTPSAPSIPKHPSPNPVLYLNPASTVVHPEADTCPIPPISVKKNTIPTRLASGDVTRPY